MKLTTCFLLVLCFLGLAAPATALRLQAPSHVSIVEDRGVLEARVFNDSDSNQPLEVFFFAPMRFSVTAPQEVPARSQAAVSININNYPPLYNTAYAARLHVFLGEENVLRQVSLSFAPPMGELMPFENSEDRSGQVDQNAADTNQATLFTGMISVLASPNTELVLQLVLVIIIVILAIAFFARLYNRVKGA